MVRDVFAVRSTGHEHGEASLGLRAVDICPQKKRVAEDVGLGGAQGHVNVGFKDVVETALVDLVEILELERHFCFCFCDGSSSNVDDRVVGHGNLNRAC